MAHDPAPTAPKYVTGDPVEAIRSVMSVTEQGLLTNDQPYATTPDAEMVTRYIMWAEGRAETYVLSRYPDLNAENAPPAFIHAILVIAKRMLLNRRGHASDTLDAEVNDVTMWLRAISSDEAQLIPSHTDDPNDDDVRYGLASRTYLTPIFPTADDDLSTDPLISFFR